MNEQDFAKLVEEYKSTIYTVCFMFSKDQDEVNDYFQETLIRIWRGLQKFESRSDIKTWIYRVALNTCISYQRSQEKKKALPLSLDANFFDSSDEGNQQIDMLHQRISQLQPFDKAIILLWLENISYEEIGSIVGITSKNVSVRLYRIREQLKKMK